MIRYVVVTFLLLLPSWLFASIVFARSDELFADDQAREVTQYTYGDAGNVVSVTKDLLQVPPTINAIAPDNVRIST